MSEQQFKDKWYAENRDEYNLRRRKRYNRDTAFRDRERKRLRDYKKKHPKPKSDGRKFIEGEEVFTITKVCKLLGCRLKLIQSLERRELLPKTTVPMQKRYYTRGQIISMTPLILHCMKNARRMHAADVREETKSWSKLAYEEWEDGDVSEE